MTGPGARRGPRRRIDEVPGEAWRTTGRPRRRVRRRAGGDHQALPRRRRERRHPPARAPRRGARAVRGERRRQVDPDEDPLRHAAARTRARSASTARRARSARPADAIRAGIGMVHQHFMLADNLTVAENVLLGAEAEHGIGARARARIAELSGPSACAPTPDVLLETSAWRPAAGGDPQGALPRRAHADPGRAHRRPRAAGGRRAVRHPARDAREGYTFLFISHKLDEVRRLADAITVIRRGTSVGTADPKTVTNRELAEMMVGSELPDPGARESTVTDREVLRVEGLTLPGRGGRAAAAVGRRPRRARRRGARHRRRRGQRPDGAGRDDHGHAARERRAGRARRRGHQPGEHAARAARRASATSPRTARATACCSRAAVGEPHPRPPDPAADLARRPRLLDLAAARRDTERIVAEFDVRTPGVDVRPRRCPAATSRSSWSGASCRRPGAAHRRAPDARGGRRRAGRDLGGAARRPRPRASRCC